MKEAKENNVCICCIYPGTVSICRLNVAGKEIEKRKGIKEKKVPGWVA